MYAFLEEVFDPSSDMALIKFWRNVEIYTFIKYEFTSHTRGLKWSCTHDSSRKAVNYFQSLMEQEVNVYEFRENLDLPQFSDEYKDLLAAPFSELDVYNSTIQGSLW